MKLKSNRKSKYTIISMLMVLVLSLSMMTSVSAKETEEYISELESLKDLILNTYSGSEVTEDELFEAAFNGMTSILDKYSVYYNSEDADAFLNGLASEYVGIGVRLELRYNQAVITEVFKGGAADGAGVQVNDVIYSVEGDLASEFDLNSLVDKIIGDEGTFVTITFKRGGAFYEKQLERKKITVPTVTPINFKVGQYGLTQDILDNMVAVNVSSFSSQTDEDLHDELQSYKDAGVEYLIIDMRNNGGGYLDTAVNMLSELIPTGNIVTLKDKNGIASTDKSTLLKQPFKVVLVVNGNSASASEIFAAAIKDLNGGVVIGEKTFGKGVAQNIYRLGTEYLVKITTQEFFSPNGTKINGVGVLPDVIVDTPEYVFSDRRFFVSDQDEQIVNVEGMLKYLGYFKGQPDEKYTKETYQAVWAFQAATGLYPYGVCDFTTQATINTEYRLAVEKNDLQLKAAIDWIVEDTQK